MFYLFDVARSEIRNQWEVGQVNISIFGILAGGHENWNINVDRQYQSMAWKMRFLSSDTLDLI